jgi:hypothetical protein
MQLLSLTRIICLVLVFSLIAELCHAATVAESDQNSENATPRPRRVRYKNKNKSNSHHRRHKAAQATEPVAPTTFASSNEPEFETLVQQTSEHSEHSLYDNSIEMFPAVAIKRTANSYAINVTAILGQSAFLPCAVRNLGTHNLLWLRVKDGDVLAYDDMLITQDQRFKLIKKASNESNLLLQNVKLSDSGEYVCQINTDSVKSKSVNLIILSEFQIKFCKNLSFLMANFFYFVFQLHRLFQTSS